MFLFLSPLAFFGPPSFSVSLSLSLSFLLFFLSSFLSFLFAFFWFLLFVSFFLFLLLLFFHERNNIKILNCKFFFWNIFSFFGFLSFFVSSSFLLSLLFPDFKFCFLFNIKVFGFEAEQGGWPIPKTDLTFLDTTRRHLNTRKNDSRGGRRGGGGVSNGGGFRIWTRPSQRILFALFGTFLFFLFSHFVLRFSRFVLCLFLGLLFKGRLQGTVPKGPRQNQDLYENVWDPLVWETPQVCTSQKMRPVAAAETAKSRESCCEASPRCWALSPLFRVRHWRFYYRGQNDFTHVICIFWETSTFG